MDIGPAEDTEIEGAVSFYTDGCSEMVEDLLPEGSRCVYPSARMVRDAAGEGGLIVARDAGRVVAACIVDRHCNDAYLGATWSAELDPGEFMVLHALRVSPDHRGMGLAGGLVDAALKVARGKGARSVRLDCLDGNERAFGVYLSRGFVQTDVTTITYEDIGVPMRFRLFELVLRNCRVSTLRST